MPRTFTTSPIPSAKLTTVFEFAINPKVAKLPNLGIPPLVLVRFEDAIE